MTNTNGATVVDARGLSCPQPVIETKKVLSRTDSASLEILVDTVTSRENVLRFARSSGWRGDYKDNEGGFRVILTK